MTPEKTELLKGVAEWFIKGLVGLILSVGAYTFKQVSNQLDTLDKRQDEQSVSVAVLGSTQAHTAEELRDIKDMLKRVLRELPR